MGLYNTVCGMNPITPALLKILDINDKQYGGKYNPNGKYFPGRFRDTYLEKENDVIYIVLYTRDGGNNREDAQDTIAALRKHPNYVKDYDDDFDNTYMYYVFTVPEKYQKAIRILANISEFTKTPREKFEAAINEIKNMSSEQIKTDTRTKDIAAALREIFEHLKKTQQQEQANDTADSSLHSDNSSR